MDQIQSVITQKMKSLINVLIKRDKVKWFEQLMVEEPSDEQLDYVDDVFSRYLGILAKKEGVGRDKDIKQLCKAVLKVRLIRHLKLMNKFRLFWK